MGLVPKIGIFKVFSRGELYDIHAATLEVLERIGVIVEEESALKKLSDAGANVDLKTKVVKIPRHLVEESIKKAPRSVLLAGRNRKYDIKLEGKRVYFGLGGGAVYLIDLENGQLRRPTKKDVGDAARLGDALANVDFVMSLVCSMDVPQPVMGLHDLDAMLRNTEKPIVVLDYGVDAAYYVKMASAVVGEGNLQRRPVLCMYSEPISPLKHGRTYVRNIMTFAKHKLPVVYIPSPMCGATAPVTVAGGIIQANAETLSGNVIMQLTNEKSPFIYGADMTIMDMRTGVFSYGAPEWMLANIAMAQLGRHYGMPIWSTGGCSDSKIFDSQAALEAALTLFVAAASGANLIHDFGFLDFGMTGSLELATLCDELASLIERVLRGIDVTDITIALEQMEKAGPGGHFLTQRHTLQLYKKEHWFPGLLDRRRRADWTLDGSKKLVQRTREKTRKILEVHGPAPLPGATEKELDNLVKGAEKALST